MFSWVEDVGSHPMVTVILRASVVVLQVSRVTQVYLLYTSAVVLSFLYHTTLLVQQKNITASVVCVGG